MPGFNQNGPTGQGPLSGKGLGVCRTGRQAGNMAGGGRGAGCRNTGGRGQGQGLMNRAGTFRANDPVETTGVDALLAEYEEAQRNLARLKEKIDALDRNAGATSKTGSPDSNI